MNAVAHFVALLARRAPDVVRRLAARPVGRFDPAVAALAAAAATDTAAAAARVEARWSDDLCGLLNALARGELVQLAGELRVAVAADARAAALRTALWEHGAAIERAGVEVSPALQPRPIVLGGHLVITAAPRGMFPPSERWPRALPAGVAATPPADEPEGLDDLLAAADRAIGVRLGRRGRDKGAWGQRAAALLGIVERGHVEPDWRGDVEVKTVPIAADPSGWWRVVEDPAIAMERAGVLAKLQRTLWLARADTGDGDATIVSWYLLEWDPEVARLARRYLHDRPKGPAGTDQRGLYLHKRFFADAGLLATLNGWT